MTLDPNCRRVRRGNSGKRLGSLKAPSAWHRVSNLPLKEELLMAEPAGSHGYGENAMLRFMLALKVVLADKGHRPPKAATHSVTQILAIEGTSQTIGAPGSCDPRLGYELFAFAPSCGNRLLEPVSLQVRMIHDYDLEFRGKFRRCVGNELKQLQHRLLILVCQDDHRSFGVAFGRVVRLRRLVEDQEARNRATFLPEPLVKREVREHVIADPVFTASHSEQRHCTIQRVCDDC